VVEHVRPVNGSGEVLESFTPGDDLILEVAVRAQRRLDDWMLGIGIDTPLGQVVYGTNTDILHIDLPPIEAGELRTVRLQLSDLRLGQGEYYVHGSVAGATREELHRIQQAAMFSVESVGDGIGVIDIRARLID
jgi:ABC-2 type transport system ATP-binding protein